MLLLAFLIAVADPAPPTPADPLLAARAAWEAHDPACDQRVVEALQTGTLDEEQLATAWLLRARCYMFAGDADRAERSYAVFLRTGHTVAASMAAGALPDPDDPAFAAAKRALPPRPVLASATVHSHQMVPGVAETTILRVRVELQADDLQLVRGALLVQRGEELARVPLQLDHASHVVSGIPVDELQLVLLDRYGNALWRTPARPEAADATADATAEQHAAAAGTHEVPGAMSYAGAAVLGAGILAMTACGIGAGVVGKDVLEDAPVLVAGLGVGALLFGVGGTLVVLDQGL